MMAQTLKAAKAKSRALEHCTPTSSSSLAATAAATTADALTKRPLLTEQIWLKCELRESIATYLAHMGIKRELLDSQPHLAHFDRIHKDIRTLCTLSNVKIFSPESETVEETLLASPPHMVVSPIVVTAEPRRSRLRRATTETTSPSPAEG